MPVYYEHCKHCNAGKDCKDHHPYPCEDSTCREGQRKVV